MKAELKKITLVHNKLTVVLKGEFVCEREDSFVSSRNRIFKYSMI